MSKSILLIEDDPIVRENTAEILNLANYHVITAENGKIGIEKAVLHKPDLIICDILMPDLDGYGVMQILMRNENLQHIPVIFLTAKTNREDIRKGMNLGASDYITKPFEESELLSAVETQLKKSSIIEKFQQNPTTGSKPLKWKELASFFGKEKKLNLKKGTPVYAEGYHGNFIFYLIKGLVKVYKYNEDGKEFITRIYKPGDYFGFTSSLGDRPYYENAETITPASLLKIPTHDFIEILKANPQIATHFIDGLALDLEKIKEHLVHLAYDSVRKKTANILIRLNRDIGGEEGFEISRSDLAALIGIAKETLIRTLKEFKDEGIIRTSRKNISITDQEKLLKIR